MNTKAECGSVLRKPLLVTPPHLNTGAIMHTSQGAVTHLTEEMLAELKAIDRDAPWRSHGCIYDRRLVSSNVVLDNTRVSANVALMESCTEQIYLFKMPIN